MYNSFLIVLIILASFIPEQVINCQEYSQSILDNDGNWYSTVTLGSQIWMAENLRTTKYNDSTPIPLITDNKIWQQYDKPGYCWYNNDESNKNKYGALYNWYAVNTKKLCPLGWHVPDTTDIWITLYGFLSENNFGFDGDKQKIAKSMSSQKGWTQDSIAGNVGNDQQSNNKSGFNMLPAGVRSYTGEFGYAGDYTHWWSSSERDTYLSIGWQIMCYYNKLAPMWKSKRVGASIRCVKNK
jgi:uncharacterized protein (TIGR02145 family)